MGSAQGLHRVELIMGTAISIDIGGSVDSDRAGQLADDAFAWFREVDERFSTYKEASEVNRLQRAEMDAADASPHLSHVLDECARLWGETDGYFDVYATGRLDPSGYVKGWSVQVASDRLIAQGAPDHCVNAGGDVRLRGRAASGQPWRVGIRHPFEPMKICWVLEGADLAVATSGTYERGFHVIDPLTGNPARALASVTVVGPDLGIADAYATAAMAMGTKGIDWLAGLNGYESAVVTEDGMTFRSEGLPVA